MNNIKKTRIYAIYKDLISNIFANNEKIDKRVKLILIINDSRIIIDLRYLNKD